jgi:hypothetical protein
MSEQPNHDEYLTQVHDYKSSMTTTTYCTGSGPRPPQRYREPVTLRLWYLPPRALRIRDDDEECLSGPHEVVLRKASLTCTTPMTEGCSLTFRPSCLSSLSPDDSHSQPGVFLFGTVQAHCVSLSSLLATPLTCLFLYRCVHLSADITAPWIIRMAPDPRCPLTTTHRIKRSVTTSSPIMEESKKNSRAKAAARSRGYRERKGEEQLHLRQREQQQMMHNSFHMAPNLARGRMTEAAKAASSLAAFVASGMRYCARFVWPAPPKLCHAPSRYTNTIAPSLLRPHISPARRHSHPSSGFECFPTLLLSILTSFLSRFPKENQKYIDRNRSVAKHSLTPRV